MASRKLGRERLLKLVKKLRQVERSKPQQFKYDHFLGNDWEGAPDLSCGTTACALGWGTAIPEFQKKGLAFKMSPSTRWDNEARCVVPRIGKNGKQAFDGALALNGKVMDEFEIGAKFFGIKMEESNYLFCPSMFLHVDYGNSEVIPDFPISPKVSASAGEVADHIMMFVKRRMTPKKATKKITAQRKTTKRTTKARK